MPESAPVHTICYDESIPLVAGLTPICQHSASKGPKVNKRKQARLDLKR